MSGNLKPVPHRLTSAESRIWWLALMENVVALIEDANRLLTANSFGRGRSLLILASEELGKSVWLYEEARRSWSGESDDVVLPAEFEQRNRRHGEKLVAAEEYGSRLADFTTGFWPPPLEDFSNPSGRDLQAAARELNLQKQAGFYVDRKDGIVYAPSDVQSDGLVEDLKRLAFVGLMVLIEDEVRRHRNGGDTTKGTARLSDRLMEFTHPGEFGGFMYESTPA